MTHSVEIAVLWETTVLHVAHRTAPCTFTLGEDLPREDPCDYCVPADALGAARAPVVTAAGEAIALVILPGASGWVALPGEDRVDLADVAAAGGTRASPHVLGARECDLPLGARARMQLARSRLAVQVSVVLPGEHVALRRMARPEPLVHTGVSFAMHVGLLAVFMLVAPPFRHSDAEEIDRDRVLLMQKLLDASAEREAQQQRSDGALGQPSREGGTGAAAAGETGAAGSATAPRTPRRYAVAGPNDNADPHLARLAALHDASTFGAIGLLTALTNASPDAPTAPWGRDDASGRDAANALGNLFGDRIGEAIGTGGLGLTGTGEAGGGDRRGIGLDDVGGLGHGRGPGPHEGVGSGHDRLGRGHPVRAPRVREGNPSVNGHIPAEVIQRIVRQSFGRFRFCYESALRGNPSLEGRVNVKFVIDRTGAVAMAMDEGSDLPDAPAVQCVVRAFQSLSFPAPEGGVVTVVYPIALHPDD